MLSARNRVERLDRGQKITKDARSVPGQPSTRQGLNAPRDELCALVDELIEGMLAIRSTLSPDDGLGETISFSIHAHISPKKENLTPVW